MFDDFPFETVTELQARGILEVADGNHGNDRPRSEEFGKGDTAFIRAADMDGGRILFESAERINDVALERIRKGKGKPGDILFSSKGTVGKLALVQMDAPPFVCSPQTTYWRTLDEHQLDRTFLYAYMQSSWFIEQWEAIKGDTDMAPYASLTSQRQFRVPLPDITFQRNVASLFRPLDEKIALNRRMNRTLEELAAALFRSWFVDFDPVVAKAAGRKPAHLRSDLAALFPAHWQDSPLGPIPHGWRMGTIKDCCAQIQNGGTPKRNERSYWDGGAIPWLTSSEVRQPLVTHTENFITEAGLAASATKWISRLSTVVALYGATAGQVSFVSLRLTTNQAVCALLPKPSFEYFNYLRMREMTDELADKAVGSAQQNISKAIVEETQVVIPNSEILGQFTKIVGPLFDLWISNLHESRTLAALRDTLLPKLLSGELRVKQVEKFVEANA